MTARAASRAAPACRRSIEMFRQLSRLALLAAVAGAVCGAAVAEVRNPNGVAMIVGNKEYRNPDVPPVDYAHRDAEAFKRYVVEVLGFDPANVFELRDADRGAMFKAFGRRGGTMSDLWAGLARLPEGGDVVVYYSGHGVPGREGGKGYLLPVNVPPRAAREDGYPLDLLLEKLGALDKARSVQVFLDACFSGGSHAGFLVQGASPVMMSAAMPTGAAGKVTMLTAAEGGQLASWDEEAGHGLFTHHLLDALYGKGDRDGDGRVTASEAGAYLDAHMSSAAWLSHGREQKAFLQQAAGAEVVLASAGGGGFPARPGLDPVSGDTGETGEKEVAAPTPRPSGAAGELPDAKRVEDALGLGRSERVAVQRGLSSLGLEVGPADGVFGRRTRTALRRWQSDKGLEETGYLTGEQSEGLMAVGREASAREEAEEARRREDERKEREAEAQRKRARSPGTKLQDCPECPELVVVPGGTTGRAFAVGVYEVTFGEWDACVSEGGCGGYRPDDKGWGRGRRPVVNVSWEDAQAYVEWLSRKTGEEYRLLSESEWEYVARAGTRTAYWWGDEIGRNRANCDGCGSRWDNRQTAPVGSFSANGFGLYDVHGNVWEWVEDCWAGDCSRRVLRGGSWFDLPGSLRSAGRVWSSTGYRDNNVGFRVARTLTP